MKTRLSIVFIVAAALVGISIVTAALFSVFNFRAETNREMAQLRANQEILADQLAVSLALPIWNFDRAQIEKVIESAMQVKAVSTIMVVLADANRSKHGRTRDVNWKVIPALSEPSSDELILTSRNIYAGGETVGVLKIFTTPRFSEAAVASNNRQWIFDIMALNAFLILCLFLLLWRLVLNPVKILERHAARVSAGESDIAAPEGAHFSGEFETLRESLDKMIHLLSARHNAVRESEERYRTVVESMPIGVAITRDTKVLFANSAFLKSREVSWEQISGKSILELVPEEFRELGRQRLSSVISTGAPTSPIELIVPLKNGELRIVESQAVHILYAGQPAAMTFIQDLTMRRLAEREREDIRRELQTLAAQLLRVQDEERRRIGRELHDSTGQTLAALEINLGMLSRRLSASGGKAAELISESVTLAGQCSEEIRTTSYLLHPPLLDEVGLGSALRWYADGFTKRSGIAVTLNADETRRRFPAELELSLFRVVQEALTNIHRHSQSSSALIRFACDDSKIELEISDEGRGIDAERLRLFREGHSNVGVGLAGMRERMRQLGGEITVESKERGARVLVRLPLNSVGNKSHENGSNSHR
jgi:PAS domain S-box-containing protein